MRGAFLGMQTHVLMLNWCENFPTGFRIPKVEEQLALSVELDCN